MNRLAPATPGAPGEGDAVCIIPQCWYNFYMTTLSYLDHFLEPMTEAFTPAMARTIVDLRADPSLQTRIDDLRRKAEEGTLTPDEEAEYKEFVEALDVVSIIQAKARRFLIRHST